MWGNTGHLSASWGPAPNSANIWATSPSKPSPQHYDDDDDDDDDDDESDDDSNGESFWDDAVKAASKSREQHQPLPQRQQPKPR